mgnify:FL=1
MLDRENTVDSLKNNKIQEHGNIKIQELPFINKINLRFDPKNKNYMSLCAKLLGIILPTKPNTYSKNENIKSLWLGPDEWLIVNESKNDLFSKLTNKLKEEDTSVTDVSENRTVIRLTGEKIFILLSKFLTLDLENNLFNQSCCAQTLFVKVPSLLIRNNNENEIPEIDIFINRSHSNYIYNLLVDGTKNLDF